MQLGHEMSVLDEEWWKICYSCKARYLILQEKEAVILINAENTINCKSTLQNKSIVFPVIS